MHNSEAFSFNDLNACTIQKAGTIQELVFIVSLGILFTLARNSWSVRRLGNLRITPHGTIGLSSSKSTKREAIMIIRATVSAIIARALLLAGSNGISKTTF